MRARPGVLASLLATLLPLVAASCGGGGGGGPTTPPPPTKTVIVFTPATGGSPGVSLAPGASADSSTLVLEVHDNGVTGLYGLAFNLTYPNTVLHFTGASEGAVLNGGGIATSLQVAESPAGTLVVGLTRLGGVPGTSTSGVLLTLRFSAVASGSGSFAFTHTQAVGAAGATLSGLSWTAGTVQVTVSP
ncbi:MAG TPA: cohesin domain-containing protein [Thermoanaerobaculia bacterium]|nr:cohesin domain-containing protein [Thermoanaerobaculia bacterium]